jgi:glycine/D-amino acid oxidase-like deaminating enzyme
MITEPVPEIKQNTFEAYIGSLMGTEEEQHCWGTSQHANGNICIGGPGLLPNHFYNDVTYEETVNTVNMIKAMFPILNEIKIIRAWCGAFAFTPDYNPYVGHITGKKGLFVIAGLNNGFALGPSLSKLGSELLLEGEASLDITTMNPMRFVNKNIILPKEYKYAGIQKYIAEHSREWLA